MFRVTCCEHIISASGQWRGDEDSRVKYLSDLCCFLALKAHFNVAVILPVDDLFATDRFRETHLSKGSQGKRANFAADMAIAAYQVVKQHLDGCQKT